MQISKESVLEVRVCRAENCDWLFLDHSKNAARAWCDMKVCGNRAKVQRHYPKIHKKRGRT